MIPQDQNEHEVFNAIHSFLSHFGIGKLLKTCNALNFSKKYTLANFPAPQKGHKH